MKKLRRYHILILREDGKSYHNKVLDFIYLKRKFFIFGFILLSLILGNIGFLYLFGIHTSLKIQTIKAKNELKKTQEYLLKLKEDVEFMEEKLKNTEKKLSELERLAREQNLKIPSLSLPGVGGASKKLFFEKPFFEDEELNKVYNRIKETKWECEKLLEKAQKLDKVLNPHLIQLSKTPSIWPVKGFISSTFGGRRDPIDGSPSWHQGIDISAPYGTPVVAVAEGIVVSAGWMSGLGNTVVIDHGNGINTLYGHLSKIFVNVGQRVKRWDKIGLVGSTGRSTGNHCHYEVHVNGKPVNPVKYLLYD